MEERCTREQSDVDLSAGLGNEFHQGRCQALLTAIERSNLDVLLVVDPVSIAYLTGFYHIATERPLALGLDAQGECFAVLPRLEREHFVERCSWIDDVDVFFDYPEGNWAWVAERLAQRGYAQQRVGLDLANMVMSDPLDAFYNMRERLGEGVRNGHHLVADLRMVKQPEEIALFRIASRYSDYVSEVGFSSLAPGVSEYEIHETIRQAVMKRMLSQVPRIVEVNGYQRGILNGRTLFGGSSSLPHGPQGTKRLEQGAGVMITYGVSVFSYSGETERCGFFGRPDPVGKTRFEVMLEAQTAGIEAIRPGVRCCDVWAEVVRVAERHGMEDALMHHAGHGKGLELHENPYLDPGDETELRPGMMLSCEPGLYFPGEFGFRHSDTILVTRTGHERLTQYPRDLESLTIQP